jgi:hypothetical protein
VRTHTERPTEDLSALSRMRWRERNESALCKCACAPSVNTTLQLLWPRLPQPLRAVSKMMNSVKVSHTTLAGAFS